jgi:hypothetical protein
VDVGPRTVTSEYEGASEGIAAFCIARRIENVVEDPDGVELPANLTRRG